MCVSHYMYTNSYMYALMHIFAKRPSVALTVIHYSSVLSTISVSTVLSVSDVFKLMFCPLKNNAL